MNLRSLAALERVAPSYLAPPRLAALTITIAMVAVAVPAAAFTTSGDLLVSPDDAPGFRLANLRVGQDNFRRPTLTFNYERTRNGSGVVRVAGRTESGPLSITFLPPITNASGTIRIAMQDAMGAQQYNYEFYFVVPADWAGKRYGDCLVSNAVRIGSPGPTVSARAWSSEERAAYEKQLLADEVPAAAPKGYDPVTDATRLVPGMPVMASRYAEWVDAEVLALGGDGRVTLRYADDRSVKTVERDGWLAIAPRTVATPSSEFKPSLRVLPGGTTPLPKDAAPLPKDLDLPRGMPLLLARGSDWKEVTVAEDRGATIAVTYPDHSADVNWKHDRTELATRRDALRKASAPGAEDRFANALPDESLYDEKTIPIDPDAGAEDDGFGRRGFGRRGFRNSYHITDHSYPIETAIPRSAQVVSDDVEMPRGTPVAYCWGRDWVPATVIADRGPLLIVKEDDNPTPFVYRLKRDQVIIKKRTLAKLKPAETTTLDKLRETQRTWTDSTGKHRVEAKLVSVTDEAVTLRKENGREVTLPLGRLSQADRELVETASAASDNPFE